MYIISNKELKFNSDGFNASFKINKILLKPWVIDSSTAVQWRI